MKTITLQTGSVSKVYTEADLQALIVAKTTGMHVAIRQDGKKIA